MHNLRDHGISPETAQEAFAGPNHIVTKNYQFTDDREQRHLASGTRSVKLSSQTRERYQKAGSQSGSLRSTPTPARAMRRGWSESTRPLKSQISFRMMSSPGRR